MSSSANQLDFETARCVLGLGEAHENWREDFPASERFVTPLREWLMSDLANDAARAGLAPEMIDSVVQVRSRYLDEPALLRMLAHMYYLLFAIPERLPHGSSRLALLPESLGAAADHFYTLAFLAAVPRIFALHAKRGISPKITTDTLTDVATWMLHYKQHKGRWGFDNRHWVRRNFDDKIITLGRLQFEPAPFGWPFRIFRHRSTGQTCALMEAGQRFRKDGQFANADWGRHDQMEYTSTLEETPHSIRGHLAFGTPTELQLSEWEQVITPGTTILSIHIPATGPLDPVECRASFVQAPVFFAAHYPEVQWQAFICASWFMDPQFGEQMPATANIVQFQRLFHPLPYPDEACDAQIYERVFNGQKGPPETLPADNTMRQIILNYIKTGGKWRTGAGYWLRSSSISP